ncbi:hypothetical protein KJ885_00675 [Patescibacteria group bacterium]|nr:hypothetical protein [Patescibacteria group bacterium]
MKTPTSTREGFLSRKRVGLILRTFATKEDDIPNRVAMAKKIIFRALNLRVDEQQLIKRIDLLVWSDKRYPGSDCGKTFSALTDALADFISIENIREVSNGDLFCGMLNFGIAMQSRNRIDYSIIASPDAYSYLNDDTASAMVDAACNGALAIGVAIDELAQSTLEGRIANTLAMWHNISLQSVGGFDLRAAKARNDKIAHYLRGWHHEKGTVFYELAGVEEVIPLAWMIDAFGNCIAPIRPQGEDNKRYEAPDPALQPELWERHISKLGTKLERQTAMLSSIGFDISFLKGGVMPAYRTF